MPEVVPPHVPPQECRDFKHEVKSDIKDIWHAMGERIKMSTFQWVTGILIVATGYVVVTMTQQSIAMAEMRSDVNFIKEVFMKHEISYKEYTLVKNN